MRALGLAGALALALASGGAAVAESPPSFFLLTYSPGMNWNDAVPFAEQPGIKAHRTYLEGLYENDIVRMGGETADAPGAVVLVRVGSKEEARSVASRDPAVINRILEVEVTGWRVDMSSMRHARRHQQPVRDPYEPFRIERLDPDAPINLKDSGSR